MDVKKVNDPVLLNEQLKAVDGKKAQAKVSGKAVQTDKAAAGDSLAISDEAQEKSKIAHYVRIVKDLPQVREDKVTEAKRKLASGEYDRPDLPGKIADKMLGD